MARLMFSAGMLAAFASAMIVRRRGFMSGSPPPARAATVNSLMMRVKTRPRLASSAPFLCLIEAHFEWPDMVILPEESSDCTSGPAEAGHYVLHSSAHRRYVVSGFSGPVPHAFANRPPGDPRGR